MSSGGGPAERCGFVVEPGDVDLDWVADDYEAESDEWYAASDAVCCWREVWDGGDGDRCIWHAEREDKSADALVAARADGPERLDGAYVPPVELGDAINFDQCGLQAATFDATDLEDASFARVDGRFVQFLNAFLRHAEFPNAFLRRARFSEAFLSGAQFPNASLREAQFHDTELWGAQFSRAYLRRTRFSGADLQRAEFSAAELWYAQFSGINLAEAKFPDAELWQVEFHDADLSYAEFPNAGLGWAKFTDADLRGAEFPDAYLPNAEFPDADLRDTDLTDADATDATFTTATLEGATLRDADLSSADLTDARLHDAHLLDVRINDGTTFDSVVPEEADAEWFDGPAHAVRARLRWWLTLARLDADDRTDRHDHLDRARTVYRTIQRLYRENSMPRRIDRYYVRARDTRRKQAILARQPLRWLYLAGQRWVMGYGERPLRVVGTSLAVVGLSALLYPAFGLRVGKAGLDATTIGYPFAAVGLLAGLGKSLYFSVITFTTLGYGDVQPMGHGEALATAESLVGAFLMALLVYVLGRRATR